jgi:hypothetical protein
MHFFLQIPNRLHLSFILLQSIFYNVAIAQAVFEPLKPQKRIVPVKTNDELIIDGQLQEPAWNSATIFDDFTEINPIQGRTPSQHTIVKLLYNSSYFYVATICFDNEGKNSIRVPNFKRDFQPDDHDYFGVIIDGFRDRRNAMVFLVNPYGVQRDALTFDDRFFDPEWDGLWKVRTVRNDSGWIAEIAIPWRTFRYPPDLSGAQTWGVNFCRQRRSTNELYAWSPFPRAYTWARMAYEGSLDSLLIPQAGTNIRVQPYALASRYKEGKNDQWKKEIKTGGEIKWAIKPDKVIDLTFNTDFAQADADQLVNNLQRFSLSFPERRSFFLENAGLFNTGLNTNPDGIKNTPLTIQPFFSRRIGLDENGNPIAIQAGLRYVQRGDRQNIGIMAIRQAASDSMSPADFFIGRYTNSIGKKLQLGTLITSRIQEKSIGKPFEGYSNWSGTLDGLYRINQKLQWNGMISATTNATKKEKGASAYSQLFYRDDLITIWWNQSYISKGYNPETGFVNRYNIINTSPGLYFTARGKWLPRFARSFGPAIVMDMLHTLSTGRPEEFTLDTYPVWFNFHSGGYAGMLWKYQWQYIRETFEPLNAKIEAGKYRYNRFDFSYGTDASKKWSIKTNYSTGKYYDGHLQSLNLQARYSPIPHLAFDAGLDVYGLKKIGIDRLTATYYLYNLQARMAINPRVQAFLFYQQNTANSSGGINARVSWEYKPLSYIYLVFNNRNMVINGIKERADLTIFKFSYLKQF